MSILSILNNTVNEPKSKEEIVKELKERLKNREKVFINGAFGEESGYDHIAIDYLTKELTKYTYEYVQLSEEKNEEIKRLWNEMEALQEKISDLYDKVCEADSEIGEFFHRGNEKKIEKLEKEYDILSDKHNALENSHYKLKEQTVISIDEARSILEKVADSKIQIKKGRDEIDNWLNS